MWRQYKFVDHGRERVGWLDTDRRLPIGTRLTLTDDRSRVWTVAWASQIAMVNHPETRWNVGGLDEPYR